MNAATDLLAKINDHLKTIEGFSPSEYVAQRGPMHNKLMHLFGQLNTAAGPFVIFAAVNKDYFQDAVCKKLELSLERVYVSKEGTLNKNLDDYRSAVFKEIETQKTKTLREIETATETSKRAVQGVAREFSVSEAVKQFEGARPSLNRSVWRWAVVSGATIALLFGSAFLLLNYSDSTVGVGVTTKDSQVASSPKWEKILPQVTLRIFVLSALATITAFSMRNYRAYLHLRELNEHRIRIAKSINTLVAAAMTAEQQDAILMQLVDSIAAFGNSGLLPGDKDTIGGQKMGLDALQKMLKGSGS